MEKYLKRIQLALREKGHTVADPTGVDPHPSAGKFLRGYGQSLVKQRLQALGYTADLSGKLYEALCGQRRQEDPATIDPKVPAAIAALEAYQHMDTLITTKDISLATRMVALIEEVAYVQHLSTLYRMLNGLAESD